MDFTGTWRTRDGDIAKVTRKESTPLGELWMGTVGTGFAEKEVTWQLDGNYMAGQQHDLELMERISERYGQVAP